MKSIAAMSLCMFAAMWLRPTPADACSCAYFADMYPEDSATDVPINTHVRLTKAWSSNVVLRNMTSGSDVSAEVETFEWRYIHWLRPGNDLDPNTTYEIVAYDGISGTDMTVGTFTTGNTRDEVHPVFQGITDVELRHYTYPYPCYNSCLNYSDRNNAADFYYGTVPEDAMFVILELQRSTEEPVFHRVVLDDAEHTRAYSGGCGPAWLPDMPANEDLCARITAYDGSGNAAGDTVVRCTRVRDCYALDDVCGQSAPSTCPAFPTDYPPDFNDPDDGGCRSVGSNAGGVLILLAVMVLGGVRRRRSRTAVLDRCL